MKAHLFYKGVVEAGQSGALNWTEVRLLEKPASKISYNKR